MTSHVLCPPQEIPVPEQTSSDRNIVEGCSEPANQLEFLKLKVKYIADTESILAGFLLVSPHCIAYLPDVMYRLMMENDHTIAYADDIVSVALYKQSRDFNVIYDEYEDEDCGGSDRNAQHSHGEIYRGEISTQIPTVTVDTALSHCLFVKVRVLSSEACRKKEEVTSCLPINEFGDKNEREAWFSIPWSQVDILYKSLVEWMPEKYANFEANANAQAPHVYVNQKNSSVSPSSDNPKNLLSEKATIVHQYNEQVDKFTLNTEKLRAKIGQQINQPGTIWQEILEYQKERLHQMEKTKNELALSRKILNKAALPELLTKDPQEAQDKIDLMRKRKNEKFRKLTDGVVKAENVAGFRGKKSIDNILLFIDGSSKNNSAKKQEINNLTKKKDMKKCHSSNFIEKSSKKMGNENEFLVDGFDNLDRDISKNTNFLSTNHDFYDSENSEHEEYLTDFIPVSRSRLPKKYANETEHKIWLKNYIEKPTASKMSEKKKQKLEKRKKCKINPYSWPFILLKPENLKVDESECGKYPTEKNVNIANSSNFSFNEILNRKIHKNEISSASNGSVSTATKNKAPFELAPLSDHCHVLSLRYDDDICEYKKIARKLDMMCNAEK